MNRPLAAVLVCATVAWATPARAQVTLTADRDNTLFEEQPSYSNGAGDFVFVGTTDAGDIRRALMRFDIASAIPAGSTITAVSLSLYCSRAKSNIAYDVSLHRATADWGESTSHASGEEGTGTMAATGDATWSHRFWMTDPWTAAGGDFASTASATTPVDRNGRRFSWSSATMVADVQAWLDTPSTNYGWMIRGAETGTRTAKRFDGYQSVDVMRRPILTVTFTAPPASGACCDATAACSEVTASACSGTYFGDGSSCATTTCPPATGACCSSTGSCSVSTSAACTGTYQGDGSMCTPNPCPTPTGACCALDGSCSLVNDPGTACVGTYLGAATMCSPNPCMAVTGACCAADGSCTIVTHPGSGCPSYQGRDTLCAPNPCPQPTGACCATDGSCSLETSAACAGTWQGASSACSPNPCPQPTGACCAADGSCTVETGAACAGAWQGASSACSPNPCPQPMGTCCAPDGSCAITTMATCAGAFDGSSMSCAPNPCPQPTGACCASDSTCAETTAAACAGTFEGTGTSCASTSCPLVLTPFVDPLPLPPLATPEVGMPGGEAQYRMAIVQIEQQLHRDLPPTTVWGYDDGTTGGTYPGPTIEARAGAPVEVTWLNDLRDASGAPRTEHILPVDPCPHGAETTDPRTVTHLHGGHVPAASDGYPEDTFLSGQSALYRYPNQQAAATLWYHDHALGITRLNVYMGLAGFYLVRDADEDALGLPGGEFEVPLVIQDRTFAADGSLVYPATWVEHFFGDTILVNGRVWPYLEVAQGRYRFRVLNGSNARTYALYLSNGASFTVIGSDGGLLEAPLTVDELTLAPGERADVIVDFSSEAAGTEVFLRNRAPAPYPGPPGEGVVPDVMKLVVQDRAGFTDPVPTTLRSLERLPEADAVMTRDFELRRGPDDCGGRAWYINGLGWDDITERPALGTTEIWRFVNRTGRSHPMHLHLDFFQVLDRQPIEVVGDVITPVGPPLEPEPWETGDKDTVNVGAHEIVRVVARFEDYLGLYPYHCHILEHEDHEMMRQFQTTTVCGDGARGLPDEECDDGNTVDGDGCSSTCRIEAGTDGGLPDGGAAPVDAGVASDAGLTDGGAGEEDGGCGCRAAGLRTSPAAAWLLLGLALIRIRRRRF